MENTSNSPEQKSNQNNSGKADLGKRFVAVVIDSAVAIIFGLIPVIGGFIGTAYMLLRDGLDFEFMDHRSVGKKLMKLRPVPLDEGPMDINRSIKRNWMLSLGVIPLIPVLGWILIPIVLVAALVIGVVEIYLVITDEEGRRWGDKLAGTKIIQVAD